MSEQKNQPIRAVLLDVDGTLIDSNDAHAEAWKEVGREIGRPIPFHRARALIGMGGDKVVPRLTGHSEDDPVGKRISERRTEIFRTRHLPNLKPFPRARDLVEQLKYAGLRVVVASSAGRDELEELLARAGLEDLLPQATSSHDVDESKPAPDVVEAALEKAGCTPREAVLVGDTPYDVAAGLRAGVHVIAVRSGGWADRDLAGAVEIYDDVAALLENLDSSILSGVHPSPALPQEEPSYGRRKTDWR